MYGYSSPGRVPASNQQLVEMNTKSLFILISLLVLSACSTTVPVVVPPIICGGDLKEESLKPCAKPSDLPEGSSFNHGLLKIEETSLLLKECSVRVELLRKTIQVCKEKFEKTERVDRVERKEIKDAGQ